MKIGREVLYEPKVASQLLSTLSLHSRALLLVFDHQWFGESRSKRYKLLQNYQLLYSLWRESRRLEMGRLGWEDL